MAVYVWKGKNKYGDAVGGERQGASIDDVARTLQKEQIQVLSVAPKKAAPGTIRADFADSIDANAVHGSDAPETAAVEVAFFFPGMNVYNRG